MSRQAEELKGGDLLAIGGSKDVNFSVCLSSRILKSPFEYVRRWTEEDRSSPI